MNIMVKFGIYSPNFGIGMSPGLMADLAKRIKQDGDLSIADHALFEYASLQYPELFSGRTNPSKADLLHWFGIKVNPLMNMIGGKKKKRSGVKKMQKRKNKYSKNKGVYKSRSTTRIF